MKPFLSQTVAEQMAGHLRREMEEGRLAGIMPGVLKLEAETGVNRKTLEAALKILEQEGLIQAQGAGKRRLITAKAGVKRKSGLRIGLFLFEHWDGGAEYVLSSEHLLGEAGHTVIRANTSLTEIGMDIRKVARVVGETGADAWVVIAASQEVLEWFIAAGIPVIAVFGRRRGLPLASVGPDKLPAFREATRTLITLGHRRIVWLTRRIRRIPEPGQAEQAFLDELAAQGLPSSSYNLPDWKETRSGFNDCMLTLFHLTPPSAIIADEAHFYFAARHYLSSNGYAVPGDVSLICTDGDRNFDWCTPSVAHIRWDYRPMVRRVVKWADNVSRGKEDKRHTYIKAEFVPGGTIGRAKRV